MEKVTTIPTVARLLSSEEGLRARKIAALKAAYNDGQLFVDEQEVAKRLLTTALNSTPTSYLERLLEE